MGPHVFWNDPVKQAHMKFYDESVQLWTGDRCDHLNVKIAAEGVCFEQWLYVNGFRFHRKEFSTGHICVAVDEETAVQLKLIFSGNGNPMDRILDDLESLGD